MCKNIDLRSQFLTNFEIIFGVKIKILMQKNWKKNKNFFVKKEKYFLQNNWLN